MPSCGGEESLSCITVSDFGKEHNKKLYQPFCLLDFIVDIVFQCVVVFFTAGFPYLGFVSRHNLFEIFDLLSEMIHGNKHLSRIMK